MSIIGDKYHLLAWPLPGEWVDKLLGRIVFDKENPVQQTAPPADGPSPASNSPPSASNPSAASNPLPASNPPPPADDPQPADNSPPASNPPPTKAQRTWIPQNIVQPLADEAVPYTTLRYLLSNIKDVGQRAQLTKFFHEKASLRTGVEMDIVAVDVKRYDISNVQYKLDMLMENPDYAKAAKDILSPPNSDRRALGVVTGILVCESITVVEGKSRATAFEAGGQVPVGAATGTPTTALDVSGSVNRDHAQSRGTETVISARGVFGVAYTDVELVDVPVEGQETRSGWSCGMLRNKKAAPGQSYKLAIDTRKGAKAFHGSGGSSDVETGSDTGNATGANKDTDEEDVGDTFTTPGAII